MEGTVKEKFSRTSNYAWVIFIGCCMVCLVTTSAGVALFGIYLLPIANTTGAGVIAASTYSTINAWGRAITTLLYGWLLTRVIGKQLNILLGVCAVSGTFALLWNGLFAAQFGIWGYYIGAVINACQGSVMAVMIAPILITNWFGPKLRGRFLGFAAAFSAIGSMIWPPVFTAIMQVTDINVTFTANGILMGIFTIPACFFMFKKRDNDVLPWGVKSWEELKEQEGEKAETFGFSALKSWKTIAFWLICICGALLGFHGNFTSHEPGAAAQRLAAAGSPEVNNAAMIGAFMLSCGAAGNLFSKLGIGFLIDKFGAGNACGAVTGICIFGMAFWVFVPATPIILYFGAFLLGCASPLMSVGVPLLIRQVFGERTLPQIQSYVSAFTTVTAGATAPLISWVLVTSGGQYSNIYIVGIIIWAIMAVAFVWAGRYVGKLPWVDKDGNSPSDMQDSKEAIG